MTFLSNCLRVGILGRAARKLLRAATQPLLKLLLRVSLPLGLPKSTWGRLKKEAMGTLESTISTMAWYPSRSLSLWYQLKMMLLNCRA